MPTQHIATLLGATCCQRLATVLRHVGCCWLKFAVTIFQLDTTTPNMSKHIATRWPSDRNMLRSTMLRYVALACCDRLAGALQCPLQVKKLIREKSAKYVNQSKG